MKTAPWLLLLEGLVFAELAQAATPTGAAFLDIDSSAEAAALGGATTASCSRPDCLGQNPAGLAALKKPELLATHARWLLDTRFDVIGYAHPASYGTLAVGLKRLGLGLSQGRDSFRQKTGDFRASDTAYSIGLGKEIPDLTATGQTSLGASLHYIESKIGSDSASTLALDLGGRYRHQGGKISAGLAARNIGQGLKFLDQRDPLPTSLNLGALYYVRPQASLSVELKRSLAAERMDASLGAQYKILDALSLRAGYSSKTGAGSSLSGLSAGFGLDGKSFSADYGWTPFGDLGNVQRFSLAARF
jgi:hypothetical protein